MPRRQQNPRQCSSPEVIDIFEERDVRLIVPLCYCINSRIPDGKTRFVTPSIIAKSSWLALVPGAGVRPMLAHGLVEKGLTISCILRVKKIAARSGQICDSS